MVQVICLQWIFLWHRHVRSIVDNKGTPDRCHQPCLIETFLPNGYLVGVWNVFSTVHLMASFYLSVFFCFFSDSWCLTLTPRTWKAVSQSGANRELADKDALRIAGVTWSAFQHGSSFSGHFPIALGSVSYQLEGCRMLACIDIMELLGLMPDAPEDITPEMAPDLIKARHWYVMVHGYGYQLSVTSDEIWWDWDWDVFFWIMCDVMMRCAVLNDDSVSSWW